MSWTQLSTTLQFGAANLSGTIVYAYAGQVLHRSLNTGGTFAPTVEIDANISCVACSEDGIYCVVGGSPSNGIYMTTDGGDSWTIYTVGGQPPPYYWYTCAVRGYSGAVAIIISEDPSIPGTRMASSDGGGFGLVWSGLSVNSIAFNNRPNTTDPVSLTNFNVVFADTTGMTLSYSNFGNLHDIQLFSPGTSAEWNQVAQVLKDDIAHIYAVSSTTTNTNVATSQNNGNTWSYLAPVQTDGYSSVYTSTNETDVYVIATANGGQIYTSTDAGSTYTARDTDNDWSASFVSNNGLIMYASAETGATSPGLFQSTDGGISCFLEGTLIRLANGEEWPIERLGIGDMVATTDGPRSLAFLGHARGSSAQFWRLPQHAVADNVPHTDLWISGGHSLLFPHTYSASADIDTIRRIHPVWREDSIQFYNTVQSPPNYTVILARDCSLCDHDHDQSRPIYPTYSLLPSPAYHPVLTDYYHIVLDTIIGTDGANREECAAKYFIVWANGMTCETMSAKYQPQSELRCSQKI